VLPISTTPTTPSSSAAPELSADPSTFGVIKSVGGKYTLPSVVSYTGNPTIITVDFGLASNFVTYANGEFTINSTS